MVGFNQFGGGFQQPQPAFNQPAGNFNQFNNLGGAFPTNQGPSIESFQKDGFKILGREPIKVKNDEGQREFADLFNLADTKIKDRAHEKPRYDLSYNPPSTTTTTSSSQLANQFS